MADFLSIARRCLEPLVKRGFTFAEDVRCRGEVHLKCQREAVTVDLAYEPYGPPWCHIHRAGQFERELHIDADFSGFGGATLLQTHDEQIEAYCQKLLRRLEDEKIAV
jgi:hypothetical protein